MTLGKSPNQEELFNSSSSLCDKKLSAASPYRYLHDNVHRLFPDDFFKDLFKDIGRRSVPPSIVTVVMVLQKLEGLSDREAVDRFAFDVRWKYAAGGLDIEYPGFVHTVLVDMRARLRDSENPNRVFDVVLQAARKLGVVGRKRVLDSTPLYDAVATQDTVTMVRSAIRGVLRVTSPELKSRCANVLKRDDDYSSSGKPECDWDDEAARLSLVDELTRDAHAVLQILENESGKLDKKTSEAARLLAAVVGQDIEEKENGTFAIARRVAKNRILSTVDPESRHGHKTKARSFDGYKGHISEDPDSEIITATVVTPGNAGDGSVAIELLSEVLDKQNDDDSGAFIDEPENNEAGNSGERVEVYGDSAYGSKEIIKKVDRNDVDVFLKVQGPSSPKGHFTKNDFDINLAEKTVTCPNKEVVLIHFRDDRSGYSRFGSRCESCPLKTKCTSSLSGRAININSEEALLVTERQRQKHPDWISKYKATRPKVERKIGHMMRRRHGRRVACVRGVQRVGQDFSLLAACMNLVRLAKFVPTAA